MARYVEENLMSEVWAAAAITVVGGVVAGQAAEDKDKSDKKHQAAMSKEESKMAAQRTSHEMALEDYYKQKDRANKQRGLDQYKQFSTMGEIAPGYDAKAEVRIDPGNMPQYGDFAAGSNDGSGGVQAGVVTPPDRYNQSIAAALNAQPPGGVAGGGG